MKDKVRERAESLPSDVWNCEACGATDSMKIRRSSLNPQFYADDIALKCMECWHFRTHGIPFESPDEFEAERDERDSRVIDFARDGEEPSPKERLAALGYLAKSKTHE